MTPRSDRSRRWSLTARLAWRLAAILVCAILLAAAAVAWRSYATLRDLDGAGLEAQADLVINHLPPSGADPDAADIVPQPIIDRFRASDGDTLFLIFGPDGRLLTTSDAAQAATLLPLLPKPLPSRIFRLPTAPDHPSGIMGFARRTQGRLVLVLQGNDQTEAIVDSLTAHFLRAALWLLLPIGLLMLAVSILTIRSGLRPLTRASAAAAAIRPSEPGRRLPVADLPVEIVPLVNTMNRALARLERTIAVQRSFMAQAAHGLRTPLAVLTARLDGLPDTPDSVGLRHDVDRMSRLVGQLLRMARLESLPLDMTETVDLRSVAAEAIAGLVPLAIQEGIELELTGTALSIRGNCAALLLAVTNLVENALGVAPHGTAIEVAIETPAAIAVRDRGAGIPPGEEARLLQPFERGAGAHEGGAGLGLAIAAQIASAHGGRLQLHNRQGGGAEAILLLSNVPADLPACSPISEPLVH